MSITIGAIVGEVAHRLLGQNVSVDTAISSVIDEFKHELRDLEARVETRLRERFEQLGLLLAVSTIDEGPREALKAFDAPANPAIPQLGLEIEIVKEITDDDVKREQECWDNLRTPTDGSSTR